MLIYYFVCLYSCFIDVKLMTIVFFCYYSAARVGNEKAIDLCLASNKLKAIALQ